MICHEVEQGTTPWLELRAGIPTSSEFGRIVTPTGKPSSSAKSYMFELMAERLMGHPVTSFVTTWMERGHELEPEAVDFYAFQTNEDPQPVGFVTDDSKRVGASPDRLVGSDGLLEIKAPKESTHIGYLLENGPDGKYFPQLQGQLWITERQWVDICSYHPLMPPALVRVERDDDYIVLLSRYVGEFLDELDTQYERLVEKVGGPERVQKKNADRFTEVQELMAAKANKGE